LTRGVFREKGGGGETVRGGADFCGPKKGVWEQGGGVAVWGRWGHLGKGGPVVNGARFWGRF